MPPRREKLEAAGIPTRVVSAPSLELFARQTDGYRRSVLGPHHALHVAIETGRGQGWHRWVGDGEIMSLNRFGASAPLADVMKGLGYTVDAVVGRVRAALAARRHGALEVSVPTVISGRVEANRQRLRAGRAPERIAARDSTLWGEPSAAVAARRLGWLDLPGRMHEHLPALERLASGLAADGAGTLYLLGMGGSSLAPTVVRRMGGNPSGRELVVVDTTDPDRVGEILASLEAKRAAVLAVSKSGTTAETSALLEIFWAAMRTELGEGAAARFVVATEPTTPLARLAKARGFRAALPHPVDVGGRYSALSVVGMFPAAWLGLDVEGLVAGGERALEGLGDGHPAVELAVALAAVAAGGWGTLAWAASDGLAPLGAWAEQLVAESTGKDGRGILPVVLRRPPGRRSSWPGTLYLSPRYTDEDTGPLDEALRQVEADGHPVVRWPLRRDALGEAFVTLELATALTGLLIGVNPFDEPDVVRAKDRARAALDAATAISPSPTADPVGVLRAHLKGMSADDAVALLAYLPEQPEVAAALDALADSLSATLHVPVTAAFGPRYLHSTGQLHKGGPGRIVPVVLTAAPGRDVPIPGQPHTLGQLRWAQATGDAQALAEAGRKVLHVHLGEEVEKELAGLGEF